MNIIETLPKEERPYEKCLQYGTETLTDIELLAVILRTGTKGCNVKELAVKLLKNEDGAVNVLSLTHLSLEQLLEINGVGKVKAIQILCVLELAKRISKTSFNDTTKYNTSEVIAGFYMEQLRHLEQEQLYVMFLDTKCKLIKDKLISSGTVNQSLISPREIFIEALRCNCVNIILVHNHPSGDPAPSREDIKSTSRVKNAGKIIGIRLLDHIIIGDNTYCSLNESGQI
ncbi:MAG: DNA repair protein RadC [Eubacterium sp.]|nr:DNA repair protein RadC [Eubacterium sp.]